MGWTRVSFGVLCVLFILGLKLMASFPVHDSHHHDLHPTIAIIGHQWWWEVQYLGAPAQRFTTANEIHIPVGRPSILNCVRST